MKKNILNKKYEGLGFVEALIALIVSGMVGVVLMGISASTLRELRQLDLQDAIAQHAVSTAVDLQNIAIRDMSLDDGDKQLDLTNTLCYGFNSDGSINKANPFDLSSGRGSYSTSSMIQGSDEYFRVFCIRSIDPKKALVEVVVGSNRVAGKVTSDSDVKDYSYLAIINR